MPETSLRADCARCAGLCCVALPFAAGVDFAIGKPAGVPCPHLGPEHTCGIHDRLVPQGFRGCVAYDCFGAGQRVVQQTFAGGDWRTDPALAGPMFAAFPVVRHLHELLLYLTDALSRPGAAEVHRALRDALRRTDALAAGTAEQLARLDVAAHRADVAVLLRRASALVRGRGRRDHSGADLAGVRWRGADLRGADLRGSLLLAADLRDADLREADLIGADLRDADLRGADLRGALYLTAPQLSVAHGDPATRLGERTAPAHWTLR